MIFTVDLFLVLWPRATKTSFDKTVSAKVRNQAKLAVKDEYTFRVDKRGLTHKTSFTILRAMTGKQFYDWQTSGGTDDVTRLVAALERADVAWCVIGGVAVNHWAEQPMVTQDVDLVVASDDVDRAVSLLEQAGFRSERFAWSVNFKGRSAVSIQLSTEDFYRDYPSRAVAADVHGMLMRVASLQDTLRGKIRAWSEPERRQSKRIKDLADIARLVEAHPQLWNDLPRELKDEVQEPDEAEGSGLAIGFR